MRTIILAAGEGTRLRPYTADRPKCMVELGGRPLLHWQLASLRQCGVTGQIVVVGGYRIEGLDAPGATVVRNPDYASTNMVATLMCARDHIIPGEDLLIAYGDIVYEPQVLRALLAADAPAALTADREWRRLWAIRMDDPLSDAETFKIGADGAILELGKKPRSYDEVQGQYMGLIRVRGDRVAAFLAHYDAMDRQARYDGRDFRNMFMTSFLQSLIDAGWPVHACLVDNGWIEIDTAEELERYRAMHADGTLAAFCDLRAAG